MTDLPDNVKPIDDKRKTVRSFVRREGRLTVGQQRALSELWPRYGIEYSPQLLNPQALFGRQAPLVLEIGFGNGEALAHIADAHQEQDFIGVEVHRPGVGHLLLAIEKHALSNVRIACHDAVDVLRHQINDNSLTRTNIYFPDPWPKKRHHKRRIIQANFVALLASKIEHTGILHLATDWQPYAEHMLEVLSANAYFDNLASGKDLATGCVVRPDERPLTKFELRGQRKGHGVWDLMFARNNTPVLEPINP